MKDKVPYTIELDTPKIAYLEEMVAKYGLADPGKALRILIDHARENPTLESAIFTDIHCVDCG